MPSTDHIQVVLRQAQLQHVPTTCLQSTVLKQRKFVVYMYTFHNFNEHEVMQPVSLLYREDIMETVGFQ